mmetsp:Transcript_69349/g.203558  ORF Transcript_69349/g.203558 Transcript_69349/m.203558 type:complete len:617 (-) Transcript_69349:194-2044(-)
MVVTEAGRSGSHLSMTSDTPPSGRVQSIYETRRYAQDDKGGELDALEARLHAARRALDDASEQARLIRKGSESEASTLRKENSLLRKQLELLSAGKDIGSVLDNLRAAGVGGSKEKPVIKEDYLPGSVDEPDNSARTITPAGQSVQAYGNNPRQISEQTEQNFGTYAGAGAGKMAERKDSKTSSKERGPSKASGANKERELLRSANLATVDLYSKSKGGIKGACAKLAREPRFEQLTLVVIFFNALWMAVDIDNNDAAFVVNAAPGFQVMAHAFCLFFTFELSVRFLAFEDKRLFYKDWWFIFDSFLLLLMILETWVMSVIILIMGSGADALASMGDASILRILRLLRITRMARMAKLLKAVPELLVMMKGIAAATRSVMVCASMLVTILYVFGVTFRQLTIDDEVLGPAYFSSVTASMNTLIGYGIFMEGIPDLLVELSESSYIYYVMMLLFAVMASWLILNMLVGVMCETVRNVSIEETEKYAIIEAKLQLEHMLKTSGLDADMNGLISRSEMAALLDIPGAAQALEEVGVDPGGLVDLADFIFEDIEELEFDEFMAVVLRLRGTKTATIRDLLDLRSYVRADMSKLIEREFGGLKVGTWQHHPPTMLPKQLTS